MICSPQRTTSERSRCKCWEFPNVLLLGSAETETGAVMDILAQHASRRVPAAACRPHTIPRSSYHREAPSSRNRPSACGRSSGGARPLLYASCLGPHATTARARRFAAVPDAPSPLRRHSAQYPPISIREKETEKSHSRWSSWSICFMAGV